MQLMGGNPAGSGAGGGPAPGADPGPSLKKAYASGVLRFHCAGVPAKNFYKKLETGKRAAGLLTCECSFDFVIPPADPECYRVVSLCVHEYCRLAVEYFDQRLGPGPQHYRTNIIFRHEFSARAVSALMLGNQVVGETAT
jgi:hypothetical protein